MWKSNILMDLKQSYLNDLIPLYGEAESVQMLNMLISHFFGLSRVEQSLQKEFKLSESEMLRLHMAVKKLKKSVPLQYIIGETQFIDYKIKVNESVLIPRPETEELVNLVISRENDSEIKILDIGTGSGCIAVALAMNFKMADVNAMDISGDALIIAKHNASINNVIINFIKDDILNPKLELDFPFDIIVSNPPYVRNMEKSQMSANVLEHEPDIALFVENDNPLKFYRAILKFAEHSLKKGGRIYFEINENLANEMKDLLSAYLYENVEVYKDINDKTRLMMAVKSK